MSFLNDEGAVGSAVTVKEIDVPSINATSSNETRREWALVEFVFLQDSLQPSPPFKSMGTIVLQSVKFHRWAIQDSEPVSHEEALVSDE